MLLMKGSQIALENTVLGVLLPMIMTNVAELAS